MEKIEVVEQQIQYCKDRIKYFKDCLSNKHITYFNQMVTQQNLNNFTTKLNSLNQQFEELKRETNIVYKFEKELHENINLPLSQIKAMKKTIFHRKAV